MHKRSEETKIRTSIISIIDILYNICFNLRLLQILILHMVNKIKLLNESMEKENVESFISYA